MTAHATWGELLTQVVFVWAQAVLFVCLGMCLMWGLMKGYNRR